MPTTESYLMTFVPERFLTDEKYRRGHINILAPREGTRILGMHTPEMKLVAKQLVKSGEWEGQLAQWSGRETSDSNSKANSDGKRPLTGKDGLTHEERMIWGLVIDYVKVPLEERLEMIEELSQLWTIGPSVTISAAMPTGWKRRTKSGYGHSSQS